MVKDFLKIDSTSNVAMRLSKRPSEFVLVTHRSITFPLKIRKLNPGFMRELFKLRLSNIPVHEKTKLNLITRFLMGKKVGEFLVQNLGGACRITLKVR